MTQNNPFLSEVVENPDNDDARLVYADYLEEQGDPRGEFIRVQCGLAALSELHPDYLDLKLRSVELLNQHGEQWASELKQDVRKIKFDRGFISTVTVLASALTKQANLLFQAAPIDWLRLNRVKGFGQRLSESPGISKIRHLDLSRLKIPDEDLHALLRSPHLSGLTKLKLDYLDSTWNQDLSASMNAMTSREQLQWLSLCGELTEPFVRDLAAGPGFPNLNHLAFGSDYSARFIAPFGQLKVPRLQSLRLRSSVNKDVASELTSLPLNQLKRLDLTGTRMPAAGLKAFAEVGAFDQVEELRMTGVKMGVRAVNALFKGDQLAHCRVLEFGDYDAISRPELNVGLVDALVSHLPLRSLRRLGLGYIGSGHLAVLAACPHLQSLEALGVPGTPLNGEDLRRICHSDWTKSLRAFDLSNVEYDSDAFFELEKAQPTFERLLRLDLSGSQIGFYGSSLTDQELELIVRSCGLPELQFLDVSWNELTDRWFDVLADLDLPNLRHLDCRGVRVSEKAIRRVLDSPMLPNLKLLELTHYIPKVSTADYGGRVTFEGRGDL